MTVISQQTPRADPSAAEAAAAGPVIACVEAGVEGLATARIAGSLARWLGTDLLLATVEQAHPQAPTGEDLTPAAVRHGRLLLDRAARELDQNAVLHVAIGEPAEKLLALAHREAAELLVVSAPHQSRVRTLLLGSVYLALAGAAPCPVVVLAPGVQTIATTGPIVCGVDGSQPSVAAALVAADLAARLETRLLLVHAVNALPSAAPGITGGHGAARGARHDDGLRLLQAVAERLPITVPKLLLVEHGPPAERLAQVAQAESAQMVVTGSRGRGRVASALLGSVASTLTTSIDRPHMIVPPHRRPSDCADRPALATRWLRSGAAVLSVTGTPGRASTTRLEREATRLVAATGGRLVIDLSESSSIDDATIRLVDRLGRRASELGGSLVLVVTGSAVRRRLDRVARPWIIVTDALDDALEALIDRSGRGSAEA